MATIDFEALDKELGTIIVMATQARSRVGLDTRAIHGFTGLACDLRDIFDAVQNAAREAGVKL